MIVPKDYYEAEVRDGFYIPSEMKRCWAATIGVLEVIDGICKRHGLKYFAEYGTLLGAVRHGGFIPWDDDFDISMKREDYMVFLKVALDELPEDYVVLSVYNNPEYDNFLSRVVNRNFISLEKGFLEENHNFPYAVGIDIFPLDHFEYNEKENELIKNMIISAQTIVGTIGPDITDVGLLGDVARDHINRFCEMCGMPLEEGRPIRQQIYILIERVCALYGKDAPYLSNMYFWVKNGNQVYKKELFENTVRLPFEFFSIEVPIGYDEKLQNCYGRNYITPYKGGGIHDYPLYGKQKALVSETTGSNYYKEYSFEKEDLTRVKPAAPDRSKREVVFLPVRAKYWRYMEKEWELECARNDTDVYVIPIPYYDKGVFGFNGDIHYEAGIFPDYVGVIPFDSYDFDKRIPDRIVIQIPYDEYDNAMTVHPRFYTKALRAATPELVYIPYFTVDDDSLSEEKARYTADFFIRTPGVTRSDRVFLQSREVRQLYIDKLCEFAGEESRNVWEERLEVREDLTPDTGEGICEDDIPQGWWKYLLDENSEGKKVILYHTNVSDIVTFGSNYIDKMGRVLDVFRQHRDRLTVIWQAHSGTQDILEIRYPQLWDLYRQKLDEYLADDYGIYDDSEDCSRAVAIADAYYGDRDRIMHDFMQTGRPVMTADADI